MAKQSTETEIRLTQAALRIRESYHTARRLMFCGALRGRQDNAGRWWVREADVLKLAREKDSKDQPQTAA